MNTLRFYRHRLRWLGERIVDWFFHIDERCEGCRRPLVIDGEEREPIIYDVEGVRLCVPCADP